MTSAYQACSLLHLAGSSNPLHGPAASSSGCSKPCRRWGVLQVAGQAVCLGLTAQNHVAGGEVASNQTWLSPHASSSMTTPCQNHSVGQGACGTCTANLEGMGLDGTSCPTMHQGIAGMSPEPTRFVASFGSLHSLYRTRPWGPDIMLQQLIGLLCLVSRLNIAR